MKEDSVLFPCVQIEKMNFGETHGDHLQKNYDHQQVSSQLDRRDGCYDSAR